MQSFAYFISVERNNSGIYTHTDHGRFEGNVIKKLINLWTFFYFFVSIF